MRETTLSLLSLHWSLSHLIMEQSLVTPGNRMHTNNHECFVFPVNRKFRAHGDQFSPFRIHRQQWDDPRQQDHSIFDVESLFTNVPIDATVQATLLKFENDPSLADCTTLTPPQIADLLNFVLRSTYFQYNGSIYEQKDCAAMGSPLYMESF